jgi:hypothetical protein
MKKIDLTGVWAAFNTPEPATTGGLKAAISDFVSRVQEYSREEHDLPERIRTLRFARAELSSAQSVLSVGAEKKCADPRHHRGHRLDDRLRTGDRRN